MDGCTFKGACNVKKMLILLLSLIFISGCGESEFDKSMSKGKEYLKNKEYELAIKSFSYALIDEPSNKDAQVLLKQSSDEKIESEMKKMVVRYKDNSKELMIRYLTLISQQISEELTVDIQQTRGLDMIELRKDTLFFISEYNEYKQIVEVHDNLLKSIEYAEKCQNNIITLLEYIDGSGEYTISEEDALVAQNEMEVNKEQRGYYLEEYINTYSALMSKYGIDIDS